jgi:hypothetical protein
MDFTVDINLEYPLEDFKEDMHGVIQKAESNVVDFPPRFGIVDDRTGDATTYRLNTSNSMYMTVTFFLNKYGPSRGPSRWMRFIAVMAFVAKWSDVLMQNGLLIEEPFAVRDDFVEHLLRVNINPKTQIIPKNVISKYLKAFDK